ncbi:RTA1-like protein [Rickenella mellea]|uniref:RTA1-like protein n=1 Tax=Rickenella mellea TaxID=50990 RepID=A0A4R5XGQ5_9AGAM|nr:RTA1-like protein [Rickenella mellea]
MSPLSLLAAATLPLAAFAKQPHRPCAVDPFQNPKTDPCNPLTYIPSNTLTGIAFGLYVAVALIQAFHMMRWGARWMAPMVIGAYTFSIGIGTRLGLHDMPDSKGIYIVFYLLVVLSPCAFIASDYILLGRMARSLNAGKHLLIPPTRITAFFITSDVTTFLIQAAGGSISIAANDIKTNKLGSNVFLAGLVLQLVSFLGFTSVYLLWLYRVRRYEPETWRRDSSNPWHRDWRTLAGALVISCIGILIRSVYRTIELSQGFKGRIATVEAFFYAFDTFPLFLAILVYVFFWPGWFIPDQAGTNAEKSVDVEKPSGAVDSKE